MRDVYGERPESAAIYALFPSTLAFVPALAPILGAFFTERFGWRALFWLLALVGSGALSDPAERLEQEETPTPRRGP